MATGIIRGEHVRGPHSRVVYDFDSARGRCLVCGQSWADGAILPPDCTGIDWLNRRIAEVVGMTAAPPITEPDPKYPARRHTKVVLLKMRVSSKDWGWMRKDFGRWVDHGIEGEIKDAKESDVPGWYENYPIKITKPVSQQQMNQLARQQFGRFDQAMQQRSNLTGALGGLGSLLGGIGR